MHLIFYASRTKSRARAVAAAFLKGCGGREAHRLDAIEPGPLGFYGVDARTEPVWNAAVAASRPFFYVDNAYFGPKDILRVTRDRMQHTGEGSPTPEGRARFAALNIPVRPWRKDGRHVLIALQSPWWYRRHGYSTVGWLEKTLQSVRLATKRPVRLRLKPRWRDAYGQIRHPAIAAACAEPDRPVADDLADCWAVIAHTSAVAIDAILSGVPAFVTGASAALPMASADLTALETPRRPGGREDWAAVLAANQWTLDEMKSGKCWHDLTQEDRARWHD